jgi:hypothetical protein
VDPDLPFPSTASICPYVHCLCYCSGPQRPCCRTAVFYVMTPSSLPVASEEHSASIYHATRPDGLITQKSTLGICDSLAASATEWFRSTEKSSNFIGNRTRDHSACTVVPPQSTTLTRFSSLDVGKRIILIWMLDKQGGGGVLWTGLVTSGYGPV